MPIFEVIYKGSLMLVYVYMGTVVFTGIYMGSPCVHNNFDLSKSIALYGKYE